jgi:hypothetical protein
MAQIDDIVSQARFFIDGPMGNFQLIRVENAKVNDQASAEVVTAAGVRGGAGIRYKEGGGEITLSVYREQGKPEVDWFTVMERRQRFAFTIQDVGGQRKQFFCAVSNTDMNSDDKGSHMFEVKLLFTGRPRLLPS